MVKRLEAKPGSLLAHASTVAALTRALEFAGVEFIDENGGGPGVWLRKQAPREAIHEACLARFRPILMTTMAAALGALPLVIATGPGSELRRPLGITIIGGLLVSQALTLYTTPVIYLLLDRLHRRLGGKSFTFVKRGPGTQPAE